jgi:hypothetical protein
MLVEGFRTTTAHALLSAGMLVALATSHASAVTLKVDDDGVQCPASAYTTIEAAVAAAAPGDKIKVCPGTYTPPGTITVLKSLKIKGKAPKAKTCNTLAPLDPTVDSIVEAPTSTGVAGIGFDVFADGVTIQGLVITHAGEAAIRTDPAYSGFTLKKVVLVENANGLYLHSNGAAPSFVKSSCFRRNTLAGIRTRYGLANATIKKNVFSETQQAAAIILDQELPATNANVVVSRNQSQGDSTFAVVLGTTASVLSKNTVDSTLGTAIFVGGNNANLEISGNTVTNAGTRGIRFNTAAFGGNASTGVLVSKNTIDKAGKHGIVIDSGAGETTLTASAIDGNVVTNSGQDGDGDGIRVEDPTASGANVGNTIQSNTISGSFNHDCHDDTSGSGTAGTGNTWVGDTAATQNVANLCKPGPANGVAEGSPSGAFLD